MNYLFFKSSGLCYNVFNYRKLGAYALLKDNLLGRNRDEKQSSGHYRRT